MKILKRCYRAMLIAAIVHLGPGTGTFAASPDDASVTVRPEDTGKALVNPDMGGTMHFCSNMPQNYG
jgi:hypothetical protein